MKVVVDTNILISGAYDESSYAFKIIQEVIAGRIQAFATHRTMKENQQMLRKLVKDKQYREFLEEFFRRLKIVRTLREKKAEGQVVDSEDIKLLDSAAAADADYLITEDREILEVGKFQNTKILTPADFWAIYKGQRGDDLEWREWTKMVMGK